MTTLFRNICTIRVFLFIFFLFFTQIYSLSQKKISFEHIGIDEGLISDKIFDIKQDQEGFIWIATYNGLDRYDGNNIVHYVSTPNDSTSLPVSLIKKLIIDEENNVWIITNSSYLVKYNRIYDNFSTISFNDINESERPIIISNVCDGLNNTLWIATLNSGLLKLNTETGTIQKIPIVGYADQPIYMVEKVNESLYLDLGDPSSLLHFNVNTKITTSITLSETPSRKAANFFSKSIYLDSAGVLWVGTIGKGLYRIEGDKTESFSRENGKLSGNIVTSILDYSKDYIWVSTDDGGISVLNKKGGLIQFINKENDNIYSLSANNIENIFKDRQGVIWVSTYGGGISRYDKGRYLFNKTIKPRQKTVNNDVLSFHENDEGDIWIGTDGGGVNKLNKEGLFNRFLYDNDNPNSISGNIITNLEEDNEDQLWMSTFGSGVSIYNKKTKKITRHTTDSGEGLSTNTVWDILKDKEGTIWVALEEGNIARYNTKLKRYEYVRNNSPEKPLLFSRTLFEDSNGVLWCSFINNGLWKIDKKKMIIEKIDLDELNYFSINHIVEDRDNRIWMATERYGLVELLNNDGTISYKKMPLLDNPNDFLFLRAIVEDDEGFLWLSSDKGVFKFDKTSLLSKHFTIENGLHSNQFSFGASLKSSDGTIYFGGVNGYSFFNPATIKNTLDIENIKITKFLIFDEEVTPTPDGLLQQNISETEKITLNYDQTTIGLEFSELNFTGSAQKYYCYVLEGFDKEWFSNRAETSVRYTNLSPGNYTFKVRSSKNQQCVDSNTISLSITVLSPWWATWWFRVIVVIAVMTFMLFIHFYRILILKEQRKKLNDKVKERTEVIRKQNQKLAKSTEKLKQANEQLEGFAYVISHDLKAPLRGISSLSQWITNDYKDKLGESGIELFDLMISKVKWLEKLINDVLEYSKTGKSDRVFVTINLNEILNDVLNALETPAHFKIDIAPLFEFNGVRSEWYQILQNLISNAIKYNDKTEGIIKIYSSESEGKNCIHVWDNGIGISEKHYDKVFEVFQTLNDTPGVDSTGIGLSTVKKLVELNNAKITIKSELGIYSCFNIDIPLDTSDESV